MAISTNQKPTINRSVYDNTGPGHRVNYLSIHWMHSGLTISGSLVRSPGWSVLTLLHLQVEVTFEIMGFFAFV